MDPVRGVRIVGTAEREKARVVLGVRLDRVRQDVEPVVLRGAPARDRGHRPVVSERDLMCRARGVVGDLRLDAVAPQERVDLCERLRVRACAPDLGEARAGKGEQTVADAHHGFRDDARVGVGAEQIVDIDDRTGMRVLDGHHGRPHRTVLQRREHVVKRALRDELLVGEQVHRGDLGIRARRALIRDLHAIPRA